MRSADPVSVENDRPGGQDVDPREVDRLREELDRARRRISALLDQRLGLERAVKDLTALTSTDELTGLPNRRCFKEHLESACAFASRQNLIVSLVALDLDDFKAYNETFGEPAGDKVLHILAGILKGATRAYDVAARHGGGTFTVLLPSTDRFDASRIAERLRMALVSHDWPLRPISASFGITTLESSAVCPMELLDQARLALRQAKRLGKNRVAHFAEHADHCAVNGEGHHNGTPRFESSRPE